MASNGKKKAAKNVEKKPPQETQETMDLKLKDTPLGKRCRELIGIQDEFSDVQDRMTKKKEEVMKLLKEAKRAELKIEGRRISIKHAEDGISVTTIKDKSL